MAILNMSFQSTNKGKKSPLPSTKHEIFDFTPEVYIPIGEIRAPLFWMDMSIAETTW